MFTRPTPAQLQLSLSITSALDNNEALAGLLKRIEASRARLAAISCLLPAALRDDVRAGPLDDARWVLLVPNAAAAAKLRQLLPTLDAALTAAGFSGPATRIKVLPKRPDGAATAPVTL